MEKNQVKKARVSAKDLRIQKFLWMQGGSVVFSIPLSWMKVLGWAPRDSVYITLNGKKSVTVERAPE